MLNKSPDLKDSDSRQRALVPDRSFIVQAPAGSGKTELLIQRYLRLLSCVDFPEEIVAITFTRKAAAEMQGRIMYALENACIDQVPKEDSTIVTDKLARRVYAQDKKCGWQLQNNPGRLRIQTIDALCAYLTRQMPFLSHFGAQPETLEDASELFQEAAARTLAELESGEAWSTAIATLLSHLDNDIPKARDMIASLLARRDQWLRHVTGELRRDELEGALKHIINTTLNSAIKLFPENLTDELLNCMRFAAETLTKENSISPITGCLGIKKLPGDTINDLAQWQGIVECLFTKNNEWRKQANKHIGFPAAGNNKIESEKRKEMKKRFSALLANLAMDKTLHAGLLDIKHLPPVTYKENEWQIIEALCELLILADAQLRVLFAEHNKIDFSGIEQGAIRALGSNDLPSDLVLHLDYQIKHILVDEFQDISINQYVLLQQLTAGWSEEDEHTLFLVGDPMQSIYRFREAEVGLYLNTWQEKRLGQIALTPLRIHVNFRSQEGIVDWVNNAFKEILPAEMDISRGAVPCEQAMAFHKTTTTNTVEVHPILGQANVRALEAEKIVDIITSIRQGNHAQKIAILVRNRGHLDEVVLHLKSAKLHFQAVEIEMLGQRPAIQDLLALTMALTHLADRIAWLAILRAPWCGLTLTDLLSLVGNDCDKTIWECIQINGDKLSKDGHARLIRLHDAIQIALQQERRCSLSRWVQSVWIKIGGPATVQEKTDLENTYTFFQLLEQFDDGGDLKARDQFIKKVSKLYAAPDVAADDSLQIMTIHKAKGLEFDVVILPGLDRSSGKDDPNLLLWSENPHKGHQDLLLAPIRESGEEESPIYDYVKRLEKEKQYNEEGRLLYVAATRAREKLHLIGCVNIKETDNKYLLAAPRSDALLSLLWPIMKAGYEKALKHYTPDYENNVIEEKRHNQILRRLTSDWTPPEIPAEVKWQTNERDIDDEYEHTEIEFDWAGETIKHIGTVVHRYVQLITEEGLEIWDEAHIKSMRANYEHVLITLGVQGNEIAWSGQQVIEALTKIIQDKRGQWILDNSYSIQNNEYRVSGIFNGKLINIIIDRTFVDDNNVRWIIDYKTSRHEGKDIDLFLDQEQGRYNDQLQKYGTLVSQMEQREVKLGLYFPLLQGWREWDL